MSSNDLLTQCRAGVSRGALACILFVSFGCSSTSEAPRGGACRAYDSSPNAVQDRVAGSLNKGFTTSTCMSERGKADTYEEACVIDASEPEERPPFARGSWTREPVTFIPEVVRKLATRERIAVATQFENQTTQVYADANLARAIVYKPFVPCEGAA